MAMNTSKNQEQFVLFNPSTNTYARLTYSGVHWVSEVDEATTWNSAQGVRSTITRRNSEWVNSRSTVWYKPDKEQPIPACVEIYPIYTVRARAAQPVQTKRPLKTLTRKYTT